ncbi:MAG: DUF6142 family protein [Lachnospiraceae bacterium]|nr:DUF6142 family protein [Lachnospiraceae bacterium]
MFTDKRHSGRGIVACVLGASGLAAAFLCVIRVYTSGGQVLPAQTVTLALGGLYGLTGLFLSIWMLLRGDSFRLFPTLGILLNGLLLLFLTGFIVLGLT